MAEPGEILENRTMGVRCLWRETASSSGGTTAEADLWLIPGTPIPPGHVHPRQEEQLTIVEGTATLRIGHMVRIAGPGETIIIPAGTTHTFGCASGSELHVVARAQPALRWDEFTARAWSIPTDTKGRPNLLKMAVLLQEYPDHLYLAGAPIPLQKGLIAVLAAVARLTGQAPSG